MANYRYVAMAKAPSTRPQGGYYDYSVGDHVLMPESCTVMEADKSPMETGLLDASGNWLYRVQETVKIGFQLR